ncbi:IS21 family transposase [Sporolactobacillus sp. THM7-7]|nr:IS21 family transposase [Sporolactobacillus sp. THM7-7]
MIALMQKQDILLMYLREGRSQREIARETGVDRKTIRKYIHDYEEKLKQLQKVDHEVDRGELIQELVEKPRYHVNNRKKRVVTDEIEQMIRGHLKENENKRKQGLHKQQKKPMDIFESLQAGGVPISYSTVLRTVRSIEKKVKEAYIKGSYTPGDICEFDWGEVKIKIGGKLRTFQMAVFTSAYGNFRMAYLFSKQKTECFQEAHAMFFKEVGGVYHTMVYDNMRVAVKRFVGPNEKEPTEGLLKLSIYYGFTFRFCNTRRGNEKGHVERNVDVIRRKAFAFQDSFESIEEANSYLYQVCMRLNQKERSYNDQTPVVALEAERPFFLRLPEPFDAARYATLRVDKYATVVIDQNHYSVPDHLVGEQVQVKIYTNRIHCFYNEQKVAEHQLLTGCHEWGLQIEHYLETLRKKPGALAGSAALQQADPKIRNIYTTHYINRERDFIELIHYLKEKATLAEIEQSIQELRQMGPNHVTTDKIKAVCAKNRMPKDVPPLTSEETQSIASQAERHLRLYDELFNTTKVGQHEEVYV